MKKRTSHLAERPNQLVKPNRAILLFILGIIAQNGGSLTEVANSDPEDESTLEMQLRNVLKRFGMSEHMPSRNTLYAHYLESILFFKGKSPKEFFGLSCVETGPKGSQKYTLRFALTNNDLSNLFALVNSYADKEFETGTKKRLAAALDTVGSAFGLSPTPSIINAITCPADDDFNCVAPVVTAVSQAIKNNDLIRLRYTFDEYGCLPIDPRRDRPECYLIPQVILNRDGYYYVCCTKLYEGPEDVAIGDDWLIAVEDIKEVETTTIAAIANGSPRKSSKSIAEEVRDAKEKFGKQFDADSFFKNNPFIRTGELGFEEERTIALYVEDLEEAHAARLKDMERRFGLRAMKEAIRADESRSGTAWVIPAKGLTKNIVDAMRVYADSFVLLVSPQDESLFADKRIPVRVWDGVTTL